MHAHELNRPSPAKEHAAAAACCRMREQKLPLTTIQPHVEGDLRLFTNKLL
jgi:hypothetical protein